MTKINDPRFRLKDGSYHPGTKLTLEVFVGKRNCRRTFYQEKWTKVPEEFASTFLFNGKSFGLIQEDIDA